MRNKTQLDNFIYSIVTGQDLDLSIYKDQDFCKSLRIKSLEAIKYLLFKMHIVQVKAEQEKKEFHLSEVINKQHPDTTFNITDYCLLAGLDELALRFIALGGKPSIDLERFKTSLFTAFPEERSKAADDIANTLEVMNNYNASQTQRENTKFSYLERFKKYFNTKYKYAALLLVTGVVCITASPFAGTVATILLITVGIPAVLASVGVYQAAKNAHENSQLLSTISRVRYEADEIKDLMQAAKAALETIDRSQQTNNAQLQIKRSLSDESIYINNNVVFMLPDRQRPRTTDSPRVLRLSSLSN